MNFNDYINKELFIKKDSDKSIVLGPGDIWLPTGAIQSMTEPKKEESEECKYHVYVDVLLFRTTVRECKKCGKLEE